MSIIEKLLQLMLGLVFLGAGSQKLAGNQRLAGNFKRYGFPAWFLYLTGAIEITGALGMLAGIFRPLLVPLAGLLLAPMMAGAVLTQILVKNPPYKIIPPAGLLLLVLAASVLRLRQWSPARKAWRQLEQRLAGIED